MQEIEKVYESYKHVRNWDIISEVVALNLKLSKSQVLPLVQKFRRLVQ